MVTPSQAARTKRCHGFHTLVLHTDDARSCMAPAPVQTKRFEEECLVGHDDCLMFLRGSGGWCPEWTQQDRVPQVTMTMAGWRGGRWIRRISGTLYNGGNVSLMSHILKLHRKNHIQYIAYTTYTYNACNSYITCMHCTAQSYMTQISCIACTACITIHHINIHYILYS